jgi:hypothetical protein
MSIIPLDLQRRCERRWAARFSRPFTRRKQWPEKKSQIAGPEIPTGLKQRAREGGPEPDSLAAILSTLGPHNEKAAAAVYSDGSFSLQPCQRDKTFQPAQSKQARKSSA